MKVSDIMKKDVVSIKEDATLLEAAMLISSYRISGLPVVNGDGECVGILSEKDLVKNIFPTYGELFELDPETPLYTLDLENIEQHSHDIRSQLTGNAMQKVVAVVTPETALTEAAAMLAIYRCRRLPVTENRKLVGIISQGDVFRALLDNHLDLSPKE
jgi:CBS domain-containing protein